MSIVLIIIIIIILLFLSRLTGNITIIYMWGSRGLMVRESDL